MGFALLNNLKNMAEPRQSPFELIDTIFKEPINILAPSAEKPDVRKVRKAFAQMVLYNEDNHWKLAGFWYRIRARLWFWTITDEDINNILLDCDFACRKEQARGEEKQSCGSWCCFGVRKGDVSA